MHSAPIMESATPLLQYALCAVAIYSPVAAGPKTGIKHPTDLLDKCVPLRVHRRPPHGAVVLRQGRGEGRVFQRSPENASASAPRTGTSAAGRCKVLGHPVMPVLFQTRCCQCCNYSVSTEPARSLREIAGAARAALRECCAWLCGGKAAPRCGTRTGICSLHPSAGDCTRCVP